MAEELVANFTLNNTEFDALFEINANGAYWGAIQGELANQLDLKDALDNLSGGIDSNHQAIGEINTTINSYGNIVTHNVAEFATSAQGALANTALQPNDNITELVNNAGYITSAGLPTLADLTTTEQLNAINSGITSSDVTQISTNADNISDIEDLIPSQATSSNQLADKDFVNSSISTNTANFIGTFNSVAELEAYTGTVTNNDYAFVIVTDSAGNTAYDRYKYNANEDEWLFEYELNNSSFTAAQWAAINSGITSGDVALINSAVQPSDLATVATSGSYNDLTNKPTIPTVNNPTITLTQGGTTKGTFTLNQNNNATIDFDNSGASSVSQLTDVELTDLTNGQGLLYNSTTQKWENATIQGGGGDITDVQVDGVSVVTNTVANITGLQPLLTSENAGDNISILNGEGGQETVSGNGTIVLEDAMADGLNSVTVSGGLKRSLLPSGYTQYDYITATGGQYFVTDYYPNDKTEIETKTFLFKQPNAPMVTRWTGSPTNDTFGFYMGNVTGRLTFFFGAYSNTKYLNVENVKTNIEHDIYMGVSSITFDGTSYSITRSTFTSTQPLYIGAFNQTGTSLAGTLSGRIYPVKFIENGQVVRHYIPCANENNVIGLYEVVTGTFIENAGTGTLKKGRPYIGIDTIPSDYTRIDFLQATGTQYIDSGVVANFANNKIEQTATVEYTTSNTDRELMGTNGYGFWGKSASNKIEAALGQMTVTDNALTKNVVSWTTNPDGNALVLNVNNNQYTSTASSFVNADYAYYIFALGIRVGSGADASFLCHAKMYDYTIAVDDEVVCYLIPVRRNSDNVLGMYNVATGTFRTNSGTGTFTAGSDVATPSPTNPIPIVCNNGQLKLGSHGKNLFNKDSSPYLAGAYISSATVGQSTFYTTTNANYNVYCIEIKPNTTYTFGLIKATDPRWVVTDGSVILDAGTNSGGNAGTYKTITTGATAKYLYLSVAVTGNYKCDDVLQVEEGSEHTEYEAFHYVLVADGITETITDSASNTATAEMLLSIGNYTDTQEILSGAVTRKVGVKILNGSETWIESSSSSAPFRLQVNDLSIEQDESNKVITLSTHFIGVSRSSTWSNYSNLVSTATNSNVKYLVFRYLNKTTTLEEFKQWLAEQYNVGTPVIVVYLLATATTETVTGQTLTTITGDNTLTISQASIDTLPIQANFDEQGGLLISFVNTNYATETWVENKGYALTSQLPTNTSDLTNDSGFVVNTATGSNSLTIFGTAATATGAINIGGSTTASSSGYSVAIGNSAKGGGVSAVALGRGAQASNTSSVAIGRDAVSSGAYSIQIGKGTTSTASTLSVGFNNNNYQLLDGTTGLIPDARLSSNIARTSAIPTDTSDLTNNAGFITGITSGDVTTALGYTPYSASNPSGYITSSALNYRAYSIVAEPTTDGSYRTATGTISTSDNNFNVSFLRRDNGKWDTSATYQLLSGATGLIPDARISSNIARTANVADTDLSNVTSTADIMMSGMGFPDNTYTDLTVGASGATYTAPANGWFLLKCDVENKTNSYQAGYQTSYGAQGSVGAYGYNSYGGAVVPMLKNQTLTFYYESNTENRALRFVYAKGSESEAS